MMKPEQTTTFPTKSGLFIDDWSNLIFSLTKMVLYIKEKREREMAYLRLCIQVSVISDTLIIHNKNRALKNG